MAGSVNLTALNNNLGAYCRDNNSKIFSDMLLGLENSLSATGVTVMDGIKDEHVLGNLMVGDVLRPGDYQNFNPGNNTLAFNNRILKVKPFKADLLIYPQEFEPTWLTMIRRSKGTYNADNFPFYQFLADKIIEKSKLELRNAIWMAVHNANGNNWASICDGFLKQILDDIAAGNIAEVPTGVIDKTNVIAAIENTVQGLGDAYKLLPGKCIVSSTLFHWYITADQGTIGRYVGFNELSGGTNSAGQSRVFVRGTNIELVQEPSFGTSQRIVVTTQDNFFMGCDTMSEYNDISTQVFNRSIKILLDGKIGVNYSLANTTHKPISVNDQA